MVLYVIVELVFFRDSGRELQNDQWQTVLFPLTSCLNYSVIDGVI